ncbi:MAG: histone deacetylase family protein [Alphaproteobacteria bacterium]|nr:histone deacetylase family protein [Alphaproteobacteria bacterium]MCB9928625.1 histone deacetylase family protein [Alphaproteobacteria bacterium]
MRAFFSDVHLSHQPPEIIARGRAVPHWEVAARAGALHQALVDGGHSVEAPESHGLAPVAAVHDPGYLEFLETAWQRWQELPNPPPAVQPNAHPGRHMTGRPTDVLGQAGYYVTTNSAPIVAGTWEAALASADTAVSAARAVLDGADVAYAACRPPGHHAYADTAGGFCYLNNVAIAANDMLQELARVAILDIDVHHGNGTQGIFYRRRDCLFVSLHGDPAEYFPFFAGYAHERGEGEGLGYNLNLPQAQGTGDEDYLSALDDGLGAIRRYAPDALLVSLGFDAYAGDPIGFLSISTEGFGRIGEAIARLGLPTVLVQEGGYNVEALGANLTSFLNGFASGR